MFVRLARALAWLQDEKGAALVEWGLLVILIAIFALVAVAAFGIELQGTFNDVADEVSSI